MFLFKANGGVCVADIKSADKIIYIGQSTESITDIVVRERTLYTTGLVWLAIGTGMYDPTKDIRFRISRSNECFYKLTSHDNL